MGPGQTDGIVQTIVTNKAVFGGSGSYPLEGGYIYSTPVGFPTYVYKLGFSGSGLPVFTQVSTLFALVHTEWTFGTYMETVLVVTF